FALDAVQDRVELLVRDDEGVVMVLDDGAVVEVQRQRLVHLHRREGAPRPLVLQAEDLGEEPRRSLLVGGRDDRVVQIDRQLLSPYPTGSRGVQTRCGSAQVLVQDADGTAGEDQPDRGDAITEQEHRRGSSQGPSLGGELWGERPTSKLINQWAAD